MGRNIPDPYELEDDEAISVLAYILHRRSEDGYLDSIASASIRDHIYLHNSIHTPAKPNQHSQEILDHLGKNADEAPED